MMSHDSLTTPFAGWVRKWAENEKLLHATKGSISHGQQWTHSLFDGGLLLLRGANDFYQMHRHLASDALQNQGKIAICEAYPQICGIWPRRPHPFRMEDANRYVFPPAHLVQRALRYRRLNPNHAGIPKLFWDSSEERDGGGDKDDDGGEINHKQTAIEWASTTTPLSSSSSSSERVVKRAWRSCCFAMDLDYGQLDIDGSRPYSWKSWQAELNIIQDTLIATGATKEEATCIPCLTLENGKMGGRAYFPASCYYPEECLLLAELCKFKLEEVFSKPHCGSHLWPQVIDRGIYSTTLRMPLVQKCAKCSQCLRQQKKPTKKCNVCAGKGRIYAGRRYWPLGVLIPGNAVLKEPIWPSLAHYLQNKATPWNSESFWEKEKQKHPIATTLLDSDLADRLLMEEEEESEEKQDPDVIIPLTDKTAATRALALLDLCSIRLVKRNIKTAFQTGFITKPTLALPTLFIPKEWNYFFDSILSSVSNWSITDHIPDCLEYKTEDELQIVFDLMKQYSPITANEKEIDPLARLAPPPPLSSPIVLHERLCVKGYALRIKPSCSSGPMGSISTTFLSLWIGATRSEPVIANSETEIAVNKHGRAIVKEEQRRKDMAHVTLKGEIEPFEYLKQLVSGPFKEFKSANPNLTFHWSNKSEDPLNRCSMLTTYIRSKTIPEWKDVRVETLTYSKEHGNWMARLNAEGMMYCNIAKRFHHNAPATLIISRRGAGEIRQLCRHSECAKSFHSFGSIQDKEVAALFAPLEVLSGTGLKSMRASEVEQAERAKANDPLLAAPPPLSLNKKSKDPLRIKRTESSKEKSVSSLLESSLCGWEEKQLPITNVFQANTDVPLSPRVTKKRARKDAIEKTNDDFSLPPPKYARFF